MDDVLQEFLVETSEGLDQLDRDLVTLEQRPDAPDVLARVFRTVHTIKGTSGFLTLPKLEAIAHKGENLLSLLRDGKRGLDAATTSALLAMADAIRGIVGNISVAQGEGDADFSGLVATLQSLCEDEKPGQVAAAPAEGSSSGGADAARTVTDTSIRVDVRLLDTLMNLVGELVLARNQILQFTAGLEHPGLADTSQRLNLVTTELQEGVMKTRMQQVGSIWTKLPRVVRDLALACGKKVRIEMEGRETELDKTIVESIKDPLTHAIRNSIDHGIETPERRRQLGKPAEGCVHLRAFHEGGMVNIEIADDGAGIDLEKVRAKAVAQGLVTADRAARMSDREAMQLITLPGFSTAERVTNVSGRGVGMDVVKTNIERIGGTVDIQSRSGQGTTLKVKIPLTLAIVPALIVTSRGERYAIPQVNLLELVRLEGDEAKAGIEHIHGTPVHRLRGKLLPLLHLDRELLREGERIDHPTRGAADGVINIVVLQADDRQFGLVVEDILDTEEIVVKPLGRQLKGVRKFAGAAIMGDGVVALILDVMGLAQEAAILSERRNELRGGVGNTSAGGGATAAGAAVREALLLLGTQNGGRAALELPLVDRLEEFDPEAIEHSAGQEVVQYRSAILPIVRLDRVLGTERAGPSPERLPVVVVRGPGGDQVGLAVHSVLDILEVELDAVRHSARAGIRGAAAVQGRVTDLLDVQQILRTAVAGFLGGEACATTEGS